ncbi:ABC transporter permease [Mesorhizobium sp. LHD-90]|uniref:ABC transporter permease n=1 Tax=Mesorhizobium sp. LHD-90 TaxID=3071414 RepID=UPI0027E17855|nr:ABC transporter permease [Mesorhizobium sp. LHD-90]MDQ6433860.1 ABC transporter permease [Mesorhizobium sp. LHD-90]
MQDLLRRYGATLTGAFVVLTAFWLLALVILPNVTLFESSFRYYLPVVDIGGPKDVYTLANYQKFINNPVETSFLGIPFTMPIHMITFFNTVIFSAIVTVITFVLSYPLAYYLAKMVSPASLPTLILLLFIPLWVSEALRAFAWYIILTFNGPLNSSLVGLGLLDSPIRWQNGVVTAYDAIVIGLVYTYVLFMVFPIYGSIQSLDRNQIEAAEDLGAKWWQTHWRVVLPHAKPGIASGCVMVFMLSAGSLLVPTVLPSTRSNWFTQTIQVLMLESQDWNSGAAYSFLYILLCTVVVTLVMWLFKVKLSDIAK